MTALAALFLSISTTRAPSPVATPHVAAAPSCACDDAAGRAEVRLLAARLDAAERRLAALQPVAALTADPVDPAGAPAKVATPAERPRYAHFRSPIGGVTVEQNPNGSIRVRNTDPALTGQIFEVQAEAEDGSITSLTLTIPPPDPG